MLNLKFYSFKEKRPEHDTDIILFKKRDAHVEAAGITSACVEYVWCDDDGNACCYNGETEVQGYELVVFVDGFNLIDEYAWWCSEEDYWKAIDEACI